MESKTDISIASLRSAFIAFSSFLLVFYWLVVATYPQYFFINPFSDPWVVRQITLTISLISWLLISTAPALILYAFILGHERWLKLLPAIAVLWPVSVVVNQIVLFIRDGQFYFRYLIEQPIFLATDVFLPILLIALYFDLTVNSAKHKL
jgi:hypothetical protein